jgi:hypothetical protein
VKAREVKKCMTDLPIILNTKQYIEYLAIRKGPTNMITNAKQIETLRQNVLLFVEPQTRVITTIGTEIPCGGPFQPIYRNLNGRWIATSPTLQIVTTPVDVVELMKEWEEVKPDDDRKLDFMYGGVFDDAAVGDIEEFLQTPERRGALPSLCPASLFTVALGPWNRAISSPSWRTSNGRSGASGRILLKSTEDHHQ